MRVFCRQREMATFLSGPLRNWGIPLSGWTPRVLLTCSNIDRSDRWKVVRCLSTTQRPRQDHSFKVKPFGKLVVKSDSNVDVNIKCLNPQKYPLQNVVLVTSPSGDTTDAVTCQQKEETIHILASANSASSRLTCDVDIPIKFDVDVVAQNDSNIYIEALESEEIKVRLGSGNCILKSVQTGDLQIESDGGNVESRSALQCNGRIKTGHTGCISGGRVLGLNFHAETDAGDVNFTAMYADVSSFVTRTGNIAVKNCHREASFSVLEKGNISIGSHDGNLKAELESGDVDVYVAQHKQVDIHTAKGNINIKVPESVNTAVSLEGSTVNIDDQLLLEDGVLTGMESQDEQMDPLLGKTHRQLNLSTGDGTITIACQDWLSSLNLLRTADLDEK